MIEPIHIQANALGLLPPIGCTALTVRGLGYQVPDSVLDGQIYTPCGDQFVASIFTPAVTGYVWAHPPGRFEFMVRGPKGEPCYVFVPDRGVAVVFRSDPTPEELERSTVVPEAWALAHGLVDEDYGLVREGIYGLRDNATPLRKFLAIRPHFG